MDKRTALLLLTGISLALWPAALSAQQSDAANPHGTFTISIDCSACHTSAAWTPTKTPLDFDHEERTDFALVGKHAEATCTSCHRDFRFDEPKAENEDCATCHVDVHQGNLSDNCASCHNLISFTDIDGISIHTRTSFPLTGAHVQLTCESCHTDDRRGAFTTIESDCISCHEEDYMAAKAIDHQAFGFPTDCEMCHSTLAWTGAVTFDHVTASAGFELVGAHDRIRCESCHIPPSMTLRFPTTDQDDCYTCHEQNYQEEHAGSGFPTTCLTCHSTSNWEGGRFVDHDRTYFPIYSGEHRGAWDDCQTCHTTLNNFQDFSCFNCHEHRQSAMDDEHRGISGYAYDSVLCYSCHPSGREEEEDDNSWR